MIRSSLAHTILLGALLTLAAATVMAAPDYTPASVPTYQVSEDTLITAHYHTFTISGYVQDAESGERLVGATVVCLPGGQGVTTNQSGFYTMTIHASTDEALPDSLCFWASYVGYHPQISSVLTEGLLDYDFSLHAAGALEEVQVLAASLDGKEQTLLMPHPLRDVPALSGEADVMHSVQQMAGVLSGSESGAGIFVRGGGEDENLILLDGVPLYHVNHQLGFFSVFNADAVKQVSFYKDHFPARYASRLSSITDVRQKDGAADAYHGGLTIGLMGAKAHIEGHIPHRRDTTGTTTFNLAGRATYYDLLYSPVLRSLRQQTGQMDMGYGFYDFNGRLAHTFSDKNKLTASFYMGDDRLRAAGTLPSGSAEEDIRWRWGNLMAAITYEHRFSRLYAETQASFTRYRYITNFVHTPTTSTKQSESTYFRSAIADATLQTNWDYRPNMRHHISFGALYTYHHFRMDTTATPLTVASLIPAHEASVYIEDEWHPRRVMTWTIGTRIGLYAVQGRIYPTITPRTGMNLQVHPMVALRWSYSFMTQYTHLLSNTSISLPTDLWVPVTASIPPMYAHQLSAGLHTDLYHQISLSIEGFYKHTTNVIEYRDGAGFLTSRTSWQDQVALGVGWSYGLEVSLQRTIGPVTGTFGYTLQRAMRRFDRNGMIINDGRDYRAKQDRTHDLSLSLQYTPHSIVSLIASFTYGTGTRASLATATAYDPLTGQIIRYVPERNNYQLPDYHRLDLGVNLTIPSRRSALSHLLCFAVYNVYNRHNTYLVLMNEHTGEITHISLVPILPNITYSIRF